MRKSDLIGNYERKIRRGFPACSFIGQKSNRMPVLNSAAARLGQALDKLGAFKSYLIEVELLTMAA